MSFLQGVVSGGLMAGGLILTYLSLVKLTNSDNKLPPWKAESYEVRITYGLIMAIAGIVLALIFLVVK